MNKTRVLLIMVFFLLSIPSSMATFTSKISPDDELYYESNELGELFNFAKLEINLWLLDYNSSSYEVSGIISHDQQFFDLNEFLLLFNLDLQLNNPGFLVLTQEAIIEEEWEGNELSRQRIASSSRDFWRGRTCLKLDDRDSFLTILWDRELGLLYSIQIDFQGLLSRIEENNLQSTYMEVFTELGFSLNFSSYADLKTFLISVLGSSLQFSFKLVNASTDLKIIIQSDYTPLGQFIVWNIKYWWVWVLTSIFIASCFLSTFLMSSKKRYEEECEILYNPVTDKKKYERCKKKFRKKVNE